VKDVEVKEKQPPVPAVSNPVLDDKSLLIFDDVLRHNRAESGVYKKKPFTLLAPSVANGVGY
jgi:hypothetical protein